MNNFLFLISEVIKGKSPSRVFLNLRLKNETIRGVTFDVGGGINADYIDFMSRDEGVIVQTFDRKAGHKINFETDILPASNNTFDTVFCLNVLEHVFNYQHLATEVVRITKTEGQIIGFVPFLVHYHPDPFDFFRYTSDALKIILLRAEARDIKIEPILRGPYIAACQMIWQTMPVFFRVVPFILCYLLDGIYISLHPGRSEAYILGYFFTCRS